MKEDERVAVAEAKNGPIVSTVTLRLHENDRVSIGAENIEITTAVELLEFAAKGLRTGGFDVMSVEVVD